MFQPGSILNSEYLIQIIPEPKREPVQLSTGSNLWLGLLVFIYSHIMYLFQNSPAAQFFFKCHEVLPSCVCVNKRMLMSLLIGYPGFQTTTYTSRSYSGIAPGYTYQFPGRCVCTPHTAHSALRRHRLRDAGCDMQLIQLGVLWG